MRFLLSKNQSKSGGAVASAWHPNFRNYSQLPDTKTVRTAFFVNALVAALMVVCLLVLFYREYRLSDLRGQIASVQEQINRNKPTSDQAISVYQKFKEQEAKTIAVDGFLKGERIEFTDLIIKLAQTLPKRLGLSSVEIRDNGVLMRGVVQGSSDVASGAASAFEKALRDDPEISRDFDTVTLTSLVRDQRKSRFSFELNLHLRSGPVKEGVKK